MCKLQTCSNKANDLEEEDLVMNDDVDDCDEVCPMTLILWKSIIIIIIIIIIITFY